MTSPYTLLATYTISSPVGNLDIPIAAYAGTYEQLVLEIMQFKPVTDSVALGLKVSTDGGASFDGGTGYRHARIEMADNGQGNQNSVGDSAISMALAIGNDANGGISGQIVVARGWNDATVYSQFRFDMDWYRFDDHVVRSIGSGIRFAAQDTTDLQLFFSSGNIASGVVKVIGIN